MAADNEDLFVALTECHFMNPQTMSEIAYYPQMKRWSDSVDGVLRAWAGRDLASEWPHPLAEELIKYATRRGLVGQEEGDRVIIEVREAAHRRAGLGVSGAVLEDDAHAALGLVGGQRGGVIGQAGEAVGLEAEPLDAELLGELRRGACAHEAVELGDAARQRPVDAR